MSIVTVCRHGLYWPIRGMETGIYVVSALVVGLLWLIQLAAEATDPAGRR